MKRNIWRDVPPPWTYHVDGPRGLFLPAIVNQEEWREFTWEVECWHEQRLYDEHERYRRELETLYQEFWGELAGL